jgi:uncharacterized protein YjiS (DUF1127 family)
MNTLIHSFDRIEPPPRKAWRPRILLAAWDRLRAALRESRDREALAQLSEWNEHMLRDVGLTREDVRSPRRLGEGRWLVENTRLGER